MRGERVVLEPARGLHQRDQMLAERVSPLSVDSSYVGLASQYSVQYRRLNTQCFCSNVLPCTTSFLLVIEYPLLPCC